MINESETKIGRNVSAAPRVSVVIPAYNIADYVREALDSVLAQTFQDYEIILVNDGSPDTRQLESALAPFFDNIIYVKQENGGASAARNAAIRLARGKLLAFLDGDDVWLPTFLKLQTIYLEKNDLEMVYCDALIFGEQLFENQTFMQTAPSNGTVSTVSLINAECNVITSGTVLKKETLEKFGVFDVELKRMQDFDLWFRLAKKEVRIGYNREVLLKYRVRPGNLSGSNVDRAKRNVEAMRVINDKYELNETERKAWTRYSRLCEAELELEKGKLCLVEGDFVRAQAHLTTANKFYRKPKLSLINWLLRRSPRLTVRLFKTIRPSEFSFITPNK